MAMNRFQLSTMEFNEILNYVCNSYVKEFGERKAQEVVDRVMTSNKLSGLISTSRYRHIPPSAKDFIYCLNAIPYFMFSRGQTQALAAVFALQRWHSEVNKELHLLSEYELRLRAIEILDELKTTFF